MGDCFCVVVVGLVACDAQCNWMGNVVMCGQTETQNDSVFLSVFAGI
jgi:hypothetical protein